MPTLTRIIALFLLAPLLIPAAGCSQEKERYQTVSPDEALQMMQSDSSLFLLDVRTAEEFESETGHLKGAHLLPVQELEMRLPELEQVKDRPILVYCRSGNRSTKASATLSANGFHVTMMRGGILAWKSAGLATQTGDTQ